MSKHFSMGTKSNLTLKPTKAAGFKSLFLTKMNSPNSSQNCSSNFAYLMSSEASNFNRIQFERVHEKLQRLVTASI